MNKRSLFGIVLALIVVMTVVAPASATPPSDVNGTYSVSSPHLTTWSGSQLATTACSNVALPIRSKGTWRVKQPFTTVSWFTVPVRPKSRRRRACIIQP